MNSTPALRAVTALLALTLLAGACGSSDSSGTVGDDAAEETADATVTVSIDGAWSRLPAEGQTVTAAYGVISNPGDEDVRITAASSSVSDTIELHETLTDDEGMMSMAEVPEGFVVPAGGEFAFEPGGPHIMILNIDPATYPSEVEITLEFEGADDLTFTAEVRESTDDMEMDMDHDDMDMDDMDHEEMDDMDHEEMDMDDSDMDDMDDSEMESSDS